MPQPGRQHLLQLANALVDDSSVPCTPAAVRRPTATATPSSSSRSNGGRSRPERATPHPLATLAQRASISGAVDRVTDRRYLFMADFPDSPLATT